ncbi:hypothetical protein AX14_012543 [Amanita brunnescens Koide BX004]|nr:hypothetical protein AX14_012543 [Amanita brunnescens Koide BX004]
MRQKIFSRFVLEARLRGPPYPPLRRSAVQLEAWKRGFCVLYKAVLAYQRFWMDFGVAAVRSSSVTPRIEEYALSDVDQCLPVKLSLSIHLYVAPRWYTSTGMASRFSCSGPGNTATFPFLQ